MRAWEPGVEVSAQLFFCVGDAAGTVPPGARRIAYYEGETDLLTVGIFVEPL